MTGKPPDRQRFLPVGLDVRGRRCLVVGGGSIGTRKAATLARVGADVTVVAPVVTDELAELISVSRVRWVQDSFQEDHLSGAFLVVAATDDVDLNATIVQAALQDQALACDASSAERSQLIFGALLEGDDVTIAVFTDGRDPARARQTRDQIADLISQERKFKPHEG